MQMTYEQAMRPGALMLFAARRGSGYMMRSEKRGGAYGSPNRRPPRRKKAGFFYIFFTLLLSVILWPIGMVMLWQRKVRMTSGTKLLISLLTLCMSVFLIVFALTVPLDNVQFTAFQDKANDWLDKAAADVAVAGDATVKKTTDTWQVMRDFADASAAYTGAYTADALDAGVKAAADTKAAIASLFHREPAPPTPIGEPVATETPEATEAPEPTEAPEATEAPADTGATEIEATPEAEATPESTEAIDLRLPDAEPQAGEGQPLEEGTLHANGDFEPGAVDALTDAPAEATGAALDEATPVPLVTVAALPTEAPAEATEAPTEVTEAPAETTDKPEMVLTPVTDEPAEATEAPAEPEVTEAPEVEVTEAPAEAEVTEAPEVEATEAPIEPEATEAPAEPEVTEAPAEEPAATEEVVAWTPVEDVTPVPTEAPAEAPAEAPTEAPAGEGVEAAGQGYTVKPAGQATVYFFGRSVGFHNGPNRHDMNNAPAHTLQEAFDQDKNPCKSCGMPDRSVLQIEHIAWVDGKNRLHTTDECEAFSGQWRLMSLDKALETGCEPCEACGADFYAEEIFPAPSPTPEPTPTPAPEVVSPATALKPAGEATVYFYDSSKGYHMTPDCANMKNAPAHTLAEAVAAGKNPCRHCNPPAASVLGLPALWLDEKGVVHTTDACAGFAGAFRLVPRDDALAQSLPPCPDCGAAEYLVPGTVLAEQ